MKLTITASDQVTVTGLPVVQTLMPGDTYVVDFDPRFEVTLTFTGKVTDE